MVSSRVYGSPSLATRKVRPSQPASNGLPWPAGRSHPTDACEPRVSSTPCTHQQAQWAQSREGGAGEHQGHIYPTAFMLTSVC